MQTTTGTHNERFKSSASLAGLGRPATGVGIKYNRNSLNVCFQAPVRVC